MNLHDTEVTAVIKLAGLAKVKLPDGKIELFLGAHLLGTYESFPGGVRYHYPEGSDYTHTSMWGKELTDELIREEMWKVAVNKLMDDYVTFSIQNQFNKPAKAC